MEYTYILSSHGISCGEDGIFEDYAEKISSKELKSRYSLVERISGAFGMNKKVSENKKEIYSKVMNTFYKTINNFDNMKVSSFERFVDTINFEAKDNKRASEKLSELNKILDNNLSKILNKENYHLNLYGILHN